MKNVDAKYITLSAIVAALYVVLTMITGPVSFGNTGISFRLSEMLVLLPFFNKKFTTSIILGTAIANFFSPMGMPDVIFGTLATAITVFMLTKVSSKVLAVLIPAVVNGIIIAIELNLILGLPLVPMMISVFIGEAAAMALGLAMFNIAFRNTQFKTLVHSA